MSEDIDKSGKVVPPPRPDAGLYVKSRDGKVVHAVVPSDHLAFQIGETACVHSGGILQACLLFFILFYF